MDPIGVIACASLVALLGALLSGSLTPAYTKTETQSSRLWAHWIVRKAALVCSLVLQVAVFGVGTTLLAGEVPDDRLQALWAWTTATVVGGLMVLDAACSIQRTSRLLDPWITVITFAVTTGIVTSVVRPRTATHPYKLWEALGVAIGIWLGTCAAFYIAYYLAYRYASHLEHTQSETPEAEAVRHCNPTFSPRGLVRDFFVAWAAWSTGSLAVAWIFYTQPSQLWNDRTWDIFFYATLAAPSGAFVTAAWIQYAQDKNFIDKTLDSPAALVRRVYSKSTGLAQMVKEAWGGPAPTEEEAPLIARPTHGHAFSW